MGRRFKGERADKAGVKYVPNIWSGLHQGKFWKRAMNKARRRAWKQNGIEGTPTNYYESYCNWKGW